MPPLMAPPLPPGFVARPAPLAALRKRLLTGQPWTRVVLCPALAGAGGFGTTTLAAAFCHDPAVRAAFPDGILWVALGERPALVAEVARVTAALTGIPPQFADMTAVARGLADATENKRCLLVIDDLCQPEQLGPFMQTGRECARLIVTRQPDIAGSAPRLRLDVMAEAEATNLLAAGLDPADAEGLQALAVPLGGWPLLLALANAALRHRVAGGEPLAPAGAALAAAYAGVEAGALDLHRPTARQAAIAAAVGANLDLLASDDRARCVELAIFPASTALPLDTLATYWGLARLDVERLAGRLAALALLQLDAPGGHVRLHAEVRTALAAQAADLGALHGRLVDAWGEAHTLPDAYAWDHYADHLQAAGRRDALRQRVLDFAWLEARLAHGGVAALVADADPLALDGAVRLVQGTLKLAAPILAADPAQLAGQLLGRLSTAAGPAIAGLLAAARQAPTGPWLRPLFPTLTAPGGPLLRMLEGQRDGALTVALCENGARAVTGAEDGTLRDWDLESGTLLRTLDGHEDEVRAVAVTPDGTLAVSASADHTLQVWDLGSGAARYTLEGHAGPVAAVALTPDEARAVSGSADGTVRVWDLESGAELRMLGGPGPGVTAVAVTPDGRRAVAAYVDGLLKVWDLRTGATAHTLAGHGAAVLAVAVTPDGQRAVSGSADRTLRVWDLRNGTIVRTLATPLAWVTAVAVTDDGGRAVSGGDDGLLRVWDLRSGAEQRTLGGGAGPIRAVALPAGGAQALAVVWDGGMQLWELTDDGEPRTREAHTATVEVVAVTPDGQRAISGGGDQTLKIWDLHTGAVVRSLAGAGGPVTSLALTADGQRAVAGAWEGPPHVWDLATGGQRILPGPRRQVRALALTDGEQRLVTADAEGRLQTWDLAGGAALRTWPGAARHILAAAFSAGAPRAITAADRRVQVWDLASGVALRTLLAFDTFGHAVALTPDGQRAFAGAAEGVVLIWDLPGETPPQRLIGHTGTVWGLALSPDGRRLVSASADQTLRVWDLPTGACLASFGGDESFHCCALAPDGYTIVAGDSLGRVHFLQLENA